MKKLIFIMFVVLNISNCSVNDIITNTENDVEYTVLPDTPTPIIQSGDRQLTVSWVNCDNASIYNIYVDGVLTSDVSSPYTVTGLINNTIHIIEVSSVNNIGESVSVPTSIMVGVIDNLNGEITIVTVGLTISKCSQKDIFGNSTFNSFSNDCSNGLPAKLSYCDTRWGCVDSIGLYLDGSGNSQVYNTCSAKGTGWRVPTTNELISLTDYYSNTLWPDIVNDWYYPGSGWNQPQPYGGYVWINIINGTFGSANFTDFTLPTTMGYVICVK